MRLVLRHAKYIDKCLDELPEFPSFRGEAWEVVPSPRPFLDHEQWVKLRKLGKAYGSQGGKKAARAPANLEQPRSCGTAVRQCGAQGCS